MAPFRLIDRGIFEYAEKFWRLDATDFAILKAMSVYSPSNLRRIAAKLGIPHTIVNYRVKRMFEDGLVRVFAIMDEEALGLESVLVYAEVPFGSEDEALKALTVHPLWRLSCLVEGAFHGAVVRYSIPRGSVSELNAYLSYLKFRGLIKDYELHRARQYYVPFPNLDFYLREESPFNWEEWANKVLEEESITFPEEQGKEIKFKWLDLYILSWLCINARIKFIDIARELVKLKGGKLDSWKVKISQTYNKTTKHLIKGYGFYILPMAEEVCVRLLVEISFNNKDSLTKFIVHLKNIPYPLALHPYKEEPTGLLHIVVPAYEVAPITKALRKMSSQSLVKSYRLLFVNRGEIWSNVMIYQAYDQGWKFNYKMLVNLLERTSQIS